MGEEKTASDSKLWTPGRIIASVVVAWLVASIGYFMFFGSRTAKGSKIRLPGASGSAGGGRAGSEATLPDFKIPTMDGRTIGFSDYRGKVLVVDFWATWCPPCRQETPALVKIANELGPRGVEVLGLHIDDRGRSSPDTIRDFVKQFGISYTIGLATDEMFIAYLGREDDAIPQTLVFGRDGRLVAHLIGYDPSSPDLDQAVQQALAAGSI
jgi:cytochrome c biogenesis protein CcmG/thiol:disulfide interchange protein DsbE